MASSRFAVPLALLAATACSDSASTDAPTVPTTIEPQPPQRTGPLPVLLTTKNIGALEAISAGTLVKRGPCLYLSGAPDEALIVWGEDIAIEPDESRVWVVYDKGTGARFSIGDRIRGGGGSLPPAQPISDFTRQPVPEECATGAAVQVHSVEVVETVYMNDRDFLPPPPPPPPPSPSFMDGVRDNQGGTTGDSVLVQGFEDPRAALFSHVLSQYRIEDAFGPRPACLREVNAAMLERLSAQHKDIYGAAQCRWENGGVKLRRSDEAAVLVAAAIDCNGERCLAEGSVTYGNLGGEGHGYVLTPAPGGWQIAKTGLSWIS